MAAVHLSVPSDAYAYIGPGAGFAVVNIFGFILVTVILSIVGILFIPFRVIVGRFKNRGMPKIDRKILKTKKVVVLGLDGMDPNLAGKMIKEGKLPNLSKLSEAGGFKELGTTVPPQSPVAWSSFITGCNPGRHNVFDFLTRNPQNYLPELSIARIGPPKRLLKIGKYRFPLSKPVMEGLRKGAPFWNFLARLGVRVAVQRVPVTFPPEKFEGRLLSSMGVPDLLGTQGNYIFVTTSVNGGNVKSGRTINAKRNGKKISFTIEGPENPFLNGSQKLSIECEAQLESKNRARLKINGKIIDLILDEFTPWQRLEFKTGVGASVYGIARFCLRSLDPEFGLYVTPINIDPRNPALPISHPRVYSRYLASKNGEFATLGLSEDTSGLNDGSLTPELFLTMCDDIYEDRLKAIRAELGTMKSGLFVHVLDITDRVSHMFWQYIDKGHPAYDGAKAAKYAGVVEETYEKCDRLVGEIADMLDDDSLFIVLSDHGFGPYRYSVNLNDWLIEEGYMKLKVGEDAEGMKFFNKVDWKKTSAYAMGLNGIYINIKGRESQGSVEPDDCGGLCEKLKGDMARYTDGSTGLGPFSSIKKKEEVYEGPYVNNSPDLVVGYAKTFRASWQTVLGGATGKVITPNEKSWSGDHCTDADDIPGVLFCNRPIKSGNPSIMDIAPTVIGEFGIPAPDGMDGKNFL